MHAGDPAPLPQTARLEKFFCPAHACRKNTVDNKVAKIGKKSKNVFTLDLEKMIQKGLEIGEEWRHSESNAPESNTQEF